MESKEIGGFLFMLILSHLCALVLSSSPLHQQSLPSDFTRGTDFEGKRSTGVIVEGDSDKNPIDHRGKFRHRISYSSGGGAGGRPRNSGDHGSIGGSGTPSTQGGTSFIPVYAAGSASNRHPNHRGDANRNRIGAPTLVAATIASFVQVYVALRR